MKSVHLCHSSTTQMLRGRTPRFTTDYTCVSCDKQMPMSQMEFNFLPPPHPLLNMKHSLFCDAMIPYSTAIQEYSNTYGGGGGNYIDFSCTSSL
jgi:hypothetical protein